MNQTYAAALLISVLITYTLRALPFLFFSRKPMPVWIERLGQLLPAAIMAVLLVYCLKDIPENWISTGIPKILGVLITALVFLKSEKTWLAIVLGTVVYIMASVLL